MGYSKAGCENPAQASQVSVGISNSQTKPTAAMAGSFSRKIPSENAGRDVAGEANQVAIKFGGSKAKQTWPGARSGYTSRDKGGPTAQAPAASSGQDTPSKSGKHSAQSVKGKDGARRPEAKQVAGKSRATA